jgi:hypothetical protein
MLLASTSTVLAMLQSGNEPEDMAHTSKAAAQILSPIDTLRRRFILDMIPIQKKQTFCYTLVQKHGNEIDLADFIPSIMYCPTVRRFTC